MLAKVRHSQLTIADNTMTEFQKALNAIHHGNELNQVEEKDVEIIYYFSKENEDIRTKDIEEAEVA